MSARTGGTGTARIVVSLALFLGGCGRLGFDSSLALDAETLAGDAALAPRDAASTDGSLDGTLACGSVGEVAKHFDGVPSPWWTPYAESPVTVAETNGELVVTLASSVGGTHYGGYASTCRYDMAGQRVYLRVVGTPRATPGAEQDFGLSADGVGGANNFGFQIQNGELSAFTRLDDRVTHLTAAAFDPTGHRYLQLRETGGVTFWETSPDAVTWTVHATLANPLPMTALKVVVAAGTWLPTADPGTARYGSIDYP